MTTALPTSSSSSCRLRASTWRPPSSTTRSWPSCPRLSSKRFAATSRSFGETMQVKASKEGITFSVQGDMGAGNVMLKPREAEKPEEKVILTVHEPVTATFALRYLVNFAKAAPLCGTVELGLGPDAPLLVRYSLE